MENKISKILDTMLIRVAFDVAKSQCNDSYLDRIVLETLRDDASMAYRLLSLRLKPWQIQELPVRIEDLMRAQPKAESSSVEEYLHTLRRELSAEYPSAKHISTLHLLCYALEDTSTATSQVLSFYGITHHTLLSIMREADQSIEGMFSPVRLLFEQADQQSQSDVVALPLLERFAVDVTAQARRGELDEVVGREAEVDRMMQILSRRKKNNPILVGEAGVGKSALVEGLAQKIVSGEVSVTMLDKRIFSLDVASLVAGTKYRGEFEERMQQLLDELLSARDVILFIDEIHTIVGAGSTQGSLDTANILKPALARGQVQIIGATTMDEYREYIEKDAALERRFQKIVIEPATTEQTMDILRRIAPRYEYHHHVRYSPEALEACVRLSQRYIVDRNLPDKAIDVMDEVGARMHIASAETNRDLGNTLQQLRSVRSDRERSIASCNYQTAANMRLQEIALQVRADKQRADSMRQTNGRVVTISHADVEQVIATITGIPVERLSRAEADRLQTLQPYLESRVVGQSQAVRSLCSALQRSRAGLRDENRPIGVFLFVGPTGVGKTLLAKELSKWLFDERRGLIRVDMSEYGERHNVARLVGSPPGYVGYGEGGQLTEAVRRQPYAVVLFDEVEKAHPDMFNLMLQIFDEGHLCDGAGRRVDFRNTIIILTSNVGSRSIGSRSASLGYQRSGRDEQVVLPSNKKYLKAVESRFSPEFLGRVDEIVCFNMLTKEDFEQIVELELEALMTRIRALGYTVEITRKARSRLAAQGYESTYGARSLRRTLKRCVEEPLSKLIVEGALPLAGRVMLDGDQSDGVELRVA